MSSLSEVRVVAAGRVPLPIALHGGEHVVLGQAGFGGKQRENEAEETLFDRNPGTAGC
jgi:hypothetical protein